MSDFCDLVIVGMLATCCAIGGCASGCSIGVDAMRNEAIKRNYAQHNPKTGEFEWIEPAKEGAAK